jgi:hypothetical protein
MASVPDKKSEALRTWVEPDLELRLRRMAEAEDRALSEYVALVLRRHVYGNDKTLWPGNEGAGKPDSDR